MQLFALCAQLILCASFLQAMDNDKIQIASKQISKPKADLFLKTSDKKVFVMRSEKAKLLDWTTQELEKNQNSGTRDNPLLTPVTFEQIKDMDSFLAYVQEGDTIRLEYNEFRNRDILPLADVIKTAWTLNCTPVCELAKKVFIQKFKEEHLKDFAEQSNFIDSFGFPEELKKSLGSLLLSAEDLSSLRSLLFTLLAEKRPAKQLVFNFSNDYLLAYGSLPDNKGFCDIWCVHSGEKSAGIMANSPINSGAFLVTPLIATLSDETCALWDVVTGKARLRAEPKEYVTAAKKFAVMSVSPDFSVLALAVGTDVALQDVKRKNLRILSCSDEGKDLGQSVHLLFTPDSSVLIEIRSTGMIRFWETKSGSCVVEEEHKKPVVKFHCNKNNVLTTVDQEGKLCLWDCTANKKLLQKWENLQRALCFNTQGDKLAIATEGGTEGSIFDITKKEFSPKKFQTREGTLTDGCYNPADKVLATSTSNNDICLWDPQQATLLARLVTERPATLLSFSADGNILASSDDSGKICLWHYCNKDIEKYLTTEINLPKGLLLFLIIDAKKRGLPLDFLKTPHLKEIYESLDVDLLTKFLK